MGGILTDFEIFNGGIADVSQIVRPSRSIDGRNVWPLHVYSRDEFVLARDQRLSTAGEVLGARSDDRGQAAHDARLSHLGERGVEIVRRGLAVIIIDSGEAVDLKVE